MESDSLGVFPKLVKEARKNTRLSQKEFGKLFDPPVTQQSVAGWERGLTTPDRKYWSKLAELLDMEVGRFYEYVGTSVTDKASLLEEIAIKIKSLGATELNEITELIATQWTAIDNSKNAADANHIRILKKGAVTWNQWRERNPDIQPNLRGVDLNEEGCTDLSGYNLSGAELTNIIGYTINFFEASLIGTDLSGAFLRRVNLKKADMRASNLSGAILKDSHAIEAILDEANLSSASFTNTNLSRASLIKANLSNTDLTGADLSDCNLRQAFLKGAVFVNCKIAGICLWDVDLKAIKHSGNLDVSTLDKNDLKKDDLAWALFCNLRHQQPEMFASSNLIKLLDSELEVIRIARELVHKYGGASPGDNSRLYVKTYNLTYSYRIYQSSDLLEVTVSDEDRLGVILRISNGMIDSNLRPDDIKNLDALLTRENNANQAG